MVRRLRLLLLSMILSAAALALLAPPALAAGYVFQKSWGQYGSLPGEIATLPGNIAVANGSLYVTDFTMGRVSVFSLDGTYLRQFASPAPIGLAVNPKTGLIYVGSNSTNIVTVYGPAGDVVTTIGTNGSANGQIAGAFGVALDSAGNVYVADSGNGRVDVFNASGTWLRNIGGPGSGDDQFGIPTGVAVDGSDNVYVMDTARSRVQEFTSTGTFIRTWGSAGSGTSQFSNAYFLTIGPSGHVLVADQDNNRIQEFLPNSVYVASLTTSALTTPQGISAAPDGRLFTVTSAATTPKVYQWAYDSTPPKITKEFNDKWWNSGPSVKFWFTDDYTAAPLVYLDGSYFTSTSMLTLIWGFDGVNHTTDGLQTIAVKAADSVGNQTSSDYTNAKIDSRPPVSSVSGVPETWSTTPLTVTIGASDIGAGVKSISYQIDGGGFALVPDGGIDFAGEGTFTLDYYATDLAGNTEVPQSIEVRLDFGPPYALDLTAPTITSDADYEWHSQDVTVNFSAKDDVSGIDTIESRIDGGSWTPGLFTLVSAPADHSKDGVHLLQYRATDLSGNISDVGKAYVKIDTRKPVTTAVGVTSYMATKAATLSFGLATSDSGSGIGQTYYAIDGGGVQVFDAWITLNTEGDHYVDYWSADNCVGLPNAESPPHTIYLTLDWAGPMAKPLNNVTVTRGKSGTFKCSFTDNLATDVTAKLLLRNKADTRTLKSFNLGTQATSGLTVTRKFKVTLPAGRYKWTVTATDPAGNVGSYAGKVLMVKL